MALAICGYTLLGILVIALGITLPIVLPRNLQAAMITTGVLAPFVAGSAFMAYKGTSLLGRAAASADMWKRLESGSSARFRSWRMPWKIRRICKKDLGKMIRKRLFLHGHLDKKSDLPYGDRLRLMSSIRQLKTAGGAPAGGKTKS